MPFGMAAMFLAMLALATIYAMSRGTDRRATLAALSLAC